MTLDEAIKHAEEVAEDKKAQAWEAQLQEEYGKVKSCKECAEEHRQLAEWLKELKQLREHTRWIPISERLPKIADVYRVTRYYPNNVMNPSYLVDACCFDGSNTWYNDNRINHERAYANNIIAWQENPEPYKAEAEDGND
jgi:hypothetical protein